MRNYTRFIPGEEIDAIAQWSFGDVDEASGQLAAKARERRETSERAANEEIRQQGYAQGFAQGQIAAAADLQRQMADFTADQELSAARDFARLFESAREQVLESQQVIARGLLELACELARQVLRHELSINPNSLQVIVREALGMLVADSKAAFVRLNPLDADLLETTVRSEFSHLELTLIPDAAIARGGCIVESGGTGVDGSLEKRWLRAIGNLGLSLPWTADDDAS